MILVLFLFGLIILIGITAILIIASTLHIQIKNLSISNMQTKNNNKYAIIFSIYFANKIKYIWFNLNSKRAKKIYSKVQLEKIDLKKFKKVFKLSDLKELTKLHLKILDLNLDMNIGTKSPLVTSFLVVTISNAISLLLPHLVNNLKDNRYFYNIKPLYYNKELYKINLDCIIEIKMVHIINVIYYIFLKKGRRKNERSTTSNRKSYAYSHE
ncbi:putative uncharacterized protein [Clostridium sp. CAG:567]|mgnify:FL=1|jgi:hypothetical protein|nr:putative uncharacterized protein [Clostridium sp. CAG:567]